MDEQQNRFANSKCDADGHKTGDWEPNPVNELVYRKCCIVCGVVVNTATRPVTEETNG